MMTSIEKIERNFKEVCDEEKKDIAMTKLPSGAYLLYIKAGTEDVFTPLAQAAIEIESKKG